MRAFLDAAIAEVNRTFVGEDELLRSLGVRLEVVRDEQCIRRMHEFIMDRLALWNEDIGE